MKEKAKKRRVFIVERKHWGVGALLNDRSDDPDKGKMCCLGFVGRQCGVNKKAMKGRNMPWSLSYENFRLYPQEFQLLDRMNMSFRASAINDHTKLTRKKKESKLRALFKKHGFVLRFV